MSCTTAALLFSPFSWWRLPWGSSSCACSSSSTSWRYCTPGGIWGWFFFFRIFFLSCTIVVLFCPALFLGVFRIFFVLHHCSIAILSLFPVEIAFRIFVVRLQFFKHKLEVLHTRVCRVFLGGGGGGGFRGWRTFLFVCFVCCCWLFLLLVRRDCWCEGVYCWWGGVYVGEEGYIVGEEGYIVGEEGYIVGAKGECKRGLGGYLVVSVYHPANRYGYLKAIHTSKLTHNQNKTWLVKRIWLLIQFSIHVTLHFHSCGTGSQTTEHLLQSCPTYEPHRKGIWPDHTPIARKLYGSLRDLRCTATFIGETGVSIWRTRRRRWYN